MIDMRKGTRPTVWNSSYPLAKLSSCSFWLLKDEVTGLVVRYEALHLGPVSQMLSHLDPISGPKSGHVIILSPSTAEADFVVIGCV